MIPSGTQSAHIKGDKEAFGLPEFIGPPTPSAELTILAVVLRTHLRGMKPAKRREFMRGLVRTMEEFESDANVVRLRGREFDAAVAMTRKQSVAWLRATLAAFFVSECERL